MIRGHTVLADWQPDDVEAVFAFSAWSYVGMMRDGCTVLKYSRNEDREQGMEVMREEAARFRHVGEHDNLVSFKGMHQHGLLFEYCERGSLADVLQYGLPLSDSDKTRIGVQVARCLAHLHSCNLIHGDISVRNVLLTADNTAKVSDLQGQLYEPDGKTIKLPAFTNENSQSRHPDAHEDEFSVRTDIFAIGTLLYCMWHDGLPFPELHEVYDEAELQARFQRGEYPLRIEESTGMDVVICKCWHSQYKQMTEILDDLMGLEPAS